MAEFQHNKPHEENIKISVEKILGASTILKRPRKNAEDKKRNLFMGIIDSLIALDMRSIDLDRAFFMDMSKYDSPFYATIDDLFEFIFTKDQVRLINFFLYERVTADGHYVDLVDDTNTIIDISTPEKLYEELKKIK